MRNIYASLLSCALFSLATPMANGMSVSWQIGNSSCGNPVGWVKAFVSGGTPPYNYAWDTGSTTDSTGGLTAGWYTVTVTDALLQTLVDSAYVQSTPDLQVYAVTSYIVDGMGFHPCPGQCDGALVVYEEYIDGQAPFNIGFDMGSGQVSTDSYGHPVFGGFCNGDWVNLYVQDAFGCTGTSQQQIVGPQGNSINMLPGQGACGGGANGSALLVAAPYDQGWVYSVEILDDQLDQVTGVTFPYDTTEVTGLSAGSYTARVHWGPVNPSCYEDHPFTVADLGASCGNVSGTLFIDHDQNCVQDGNDPAIPYRLLEINPGPVYALTDANGHYSRNLLYGNFDLGLTAPDLLQLCPGTSPAPFTIDSNTPLVTLDLADSSLIDLDLTTQSGNTAARPGFTTSYWVQVRNLSGQLSGPIDATFTFDPTFTYVSASPTPISMVGNTITWALPTLNSFGITGVWVQLSLPPNPGLIGTVVTSDFSFTNTLTETSLTNNAVTFSTTIVGSYDPNEKSVEPRDLFLIGTDSTLTYTIQFQNTGTDTAFTVAVLDTLASNLDLGTLELLGSSHPFTPSFDADRVLRFTFSNILLPDSGTNEPASHGYISFRIRPQWPLLPGTVFSNAADIFFDFNPPVRTNEAVVTAESSTTIEEVEPSRLRVFPNPAHDVLRWFDLEHEPAVSAEIFSADGRSVMHMNIPQGSSAINIQDLARGSYMIAIRTLDGRTFTQRFSKL